MKKHFSLIRTNSNLAYASEVATLLGVEIASAERKQFVDGEVSFLLPEINSSQETIIFHDCLPDPNQKLVELLLFLDALQRQKPSRVTLVCPYLAYLRQDKVEPNFSSFGAKFISKQLAALGVTRLICLDPHSTSCLTNSGIELAAVTALPLFIAHLKAKVTSSFSLVAPDQGVAKLVKVSGEKFSLPTIFLAKQRRWNSTEALTVKLLQGEIKAQHCVIFDDVVTSGTTLFKTMDLLFEQGAATVSACVTHSLLTNQAGRKLTNSRLDFLLTRSRVGIIENYAKLKQISAAGLIADQLRLSTGYNFKDQGELQ